METLRTTETVRIKWDGFQENIVRKRYGILPFLTQDGYNFMLTGLFP